MVVGGTMYVANALTKPLCISLLKWLFRMLASNDDEANFQMG